MRTEAYSIRVGFTLALRSEPGESACHRRHASCGLAAEAACSTVIADVYLIGHIVATVW
jgi:hypothetical protein